MELWLWTQGHRDNGLEDDPKYLLSNSKPKIISVERAHFVREGCAPCTLSFLSSGTLWLLLGRLVLLNHCIHPLKHILPLLACEEQTGGADSEGRGRVELGGARLLLLDLAMKSSPQNPPHTRLPPMLHSDSRKSLHVLIWDLLWFHIIYLHFTQQCK